MKRLFLLSCFTILVSFVLSSCNQMDKPSATNNEFSGTTWMVYRDLEDHFSYTNRERPFVYRLKFEDDTHFSVDLLDKKMRVIATEANGTYKVVDGKPVFDIFGNVVYDSKNRTIYIIDLPLKFIKQ